MFLDRCGRTVSSGRVGRGEVPNILSKDGADQCVRFTDCVASSSEGELDKVEQMLLHATSNGLTQTVAPSRRGSVHHLPRDASRILAIARQVQRGSVVHCRLKRDDFPLIDRKDSERFIPQSSSVLG